MKMPEIIHSLLSSDTILRHVQSLIEECIEEVECIRKVRRKRDKNLHLSVTPDLLVLQVAHATLQEEKLRFNIKAPRS